MCGCVGLYIHVPRHTDKIRITLQSAERKRLTSSLNGFDLLFSLAYGIGYMKCPSQRHGKVEILSSYLLGRSAEGDTSIHRHKCAIAKF